MIKFLTEEIRIQFHRLPLDRQREVMIQADGLFLLEGKSLTVLFADAETLELTVRVEEKPHVVGPFNRDPA